MTTLRGAQRLPMGERGAAVLALLLGLILVGFWQVYGFGGV
jgi:hypothetical protein